jgi:hypothetical protein
MLAELRLSFNLESSIAFQTSTVMNVKSIERWSIANAELMKLPAVSLYQI